MCHEKYMNPKLRHHHCCVPFPAARMAGKFMKPFMKPFGNYIPYNIEDLGDGYLITIPLPGRTKDDVTVSLINNILNITASKPKEYQKSEEEKEKSVFGRISKLFK